MSKSQTIEKKLENIEATLQDVVSTVNAGFSGNEVRLNNIETASQDMATAVNDGFSDIEARMVTKDELKEEFAKMETRLVTKDYLDDKLGDLRADFNISMRKSYPGFSIRA